MVSSALPASALNWSTAPRRLPLPSTPSAKVVGVMVVGTHRSSNDSRHNLRVGGRRPRRVRLWNEQKSNDPTIEGNHMIYVSFVNAVCDKIATPTLSRCSPRLCGQSNGLSTDSEHGFVVSEHVRKPSVISV